MSHEGISPRFESAWQRAWFLLQKILGIISVLCSGAINHFLFITINHAGIDGLSTFHVMRVFFQYLGDLAYGEPHNSNDSFELLWLLLSSSVGGLFFLRNWDADDVKKKTCSSEVMQIFKENSNSQALIDNICASSQFYFSNRLWLLTLLVVLFKVIEICSKRYTEIISMRKLMCDMYSRLWASIGTAKRKCGHWWASAWNRCDSTQTFTG